MESNSICGSGEGSDGSRNGGEGGEDGEDSQGRGVSMAAPVVRKAGIDQSQALSLVGAPVVISFFWAF